MKRNAVTMNFSRQPSDFLLFSQTLFCFFWCFICAMLAPLRDSIISKSARETTKSSNSMVSYGKLEYLCIWLIMLYLYIFVARNKRMRSATMFRIQEIAPKMLLSHSLSLFLSLCSKLAAASISCLFSSPRLPLSSFTVEASTTTTANVQIALASF